MAALLFVLTDATAAPDRAATGLWHAHAAAEAGHEVVLWLAGEGVRLAVTGVAETLREPLPRSAAALLDGLAKAGARICAERSGFERRRYELEALRPGAEVVEPGELAALLAAGHRAVSL